MSFAPCGILPTQHASDLILLLKNTINFVLTNSIFLIQDVILVNRPQIFSDFFYRVTRQKPFNKSILRILKILTFFTFHYLWLFYCIENFLDFRFQNGWLLLQ